MATTRPRGFYLPQFSLACAFLGMFCLGIILEPIALYNSLRALRLQRLDPTLPGRTITVVALVISAVGTVFWVSLFVAGLVRGGGPPPAWPLPWGRS